MNLSKNKEQQSSVGSLGAIMALLVSRGNGGNRRTVIRSLFSLAVVFLLTVGVVAVPEEQIAAVQDQQQQQVALSTISF